MGASLKGFKQKDTHFERCRHGIETQLFMYFSPYPAPSSNSSYIFTSSSSSNCSFFSTSSTSSSSMSFSSSSSRCISNIMPFCCKETTTEWASAHHLLKQQQSQSLTCAGLTLRGLLLSGFLVFSTTKVLCWVCRSCGWSSWTHGVQSDWRISFCHLSSGEGLQKRWRCSYLSCSLKSSLPYVLLVLLPDEL